MSILMPACGRNTEMAAVGEMSGKPQVSTESQANETTQQTSDNSEADEETERDILYISAGDTVFTAVLEDNSSAEGLKQLLSKGDLTIDMRDYGGFEKVGDLGTALPRNDTDITTEAGDLILYQGNNFVIYYGENSWNFTKLGKIEGVTKEDLLSVLGEGDVKVTLSMEK